MIDCSRNGVMLASAVKFLLRQLALMGNNVLQVRGRTRRNRIGKGPQADDGSPCASFTPKKHIKSKANPSLAIFEVATLRRSFARSTTTPSHCLSFPSFVQAHKL